MCGIAGIITKEPAHGVLGAMLARLVHRGPDGAGEWFARAAGWHVALGHRRLSIIDLEGGRQPMGSADARLELTFNGEVFNFADLRRSLAARGYTFATRSDTEVLLYHFAEHGTRGLGDLSGMFAFAVWDARTRTLTLARDRAGIKPLYYASLPDGGIAFASELSALTRCPHVERKLGVEGLESYFFSDYAHAPLTLLSGARKLGPGEYLEWRDGRLQDPRTFWALAPIDVGAAGDDEAIAREFWARFDSAVTRELVSDVPVGVFLSGGLDSSSVAVLAQKRAPSRLKTFSMGFDDPEFDESAYARQVALQIGSEHIEERLTAQRVLETVGVALASLDEPLADPSYLPTFLLSRLAARHVKVALGGDGGDELWGGYPTYLAHRYGAGFSKVPGALRKGLANLACAIPPSDGYQSLEWKLKHFLRRFDPDPLRRHLRWMSGTDLGDLAELFSHLAPAEPITLRTRVPALGDALNELLALDFLTYLPGSVLTKVDRASMAHGLEVRPPLLDNELVDWVFALPSTCKVRWGRTKYLFKKAAAPHLPQGIVHRRKKGFAIPLAAWLRGPLRALVDEALGPSPLWDLGLRRDVLLRWRDEHSARVGDRSKPLWALVVLGQWIKREGITA